MLAPGGIPRFRLQLKDSGTWFLTAAPDAAGFDFPDLSSALSFACAEAGGAEADIELLAGGLYMFVHQPSGWPHRLCASSREQPTDGRVHDTHAAFTPTSKDHDRNLRRRWIPRPNSQQIMRRQ
jgi:hypothetical protein